MAHSSAGGGAAWPSCPAVAIPRPAPRVSAPTARRSVSGRTRPAAVELYREGAAFVYVPRLTSVRELAEIVIHALDADPVAAREVAERDLAARSEVLP